VILEIENLDFYYGDAQALDSVSLAAKEGELIAIVGANGAGKTSLIRTIAGMLTPRAGRIRFRGNDITGLPSHRVCNLGIGQVAEGRQIFPSLSVEENLQVGAMLPRAHGQEREAVCISGCSRLAERRQIAGTMSGGERRCWRSAAASWPAGTDHVRRAIAACAFWCRSCSRPSARCARAGSLCCS
jgi:branched-chain amino acid transport system ATP-binding protein